MATKALLTEAETAYHRLMTGAAVVEVHDQNGETLKFQAASAVKLQAYITQLKRDLGLLSQQCGSSPMRVWF